MSGAAAAQATDDARDVSGRPGARCDIRDCGPAPAYPNQLCPDGKNFSGRGPCARGENGECHWTRLKCPAGNAPPERDPDGAPPFGLTPGPTLPPRVNPPPPAWTLPEPSPPSLADDVARIRAFLDDADPAQRISGCMLIRGKVQAHGVKALSDAVMPLLVLHLRDPDAEVRTWVVTAMRVLDDRALGELRHALEQEREPKVRNALAAVIRQFEEARAEAASRAAHPCNRVSPEVALTWPVEELCDPIGHYPPILFGLPDGTSVYQRGDKECFRGHRGPCFKKCLPGSTLIATPGGLTRVDALRPGAEVWTVDASGGRVAAPVVRASSVEVGAHHELIRLVLADGRAVQASWFHPTATGQLMGQVTRGQALDGSTVVDVQRIPYRGDRTFDILPAGATGTYFADGVLLGSSLRQPK